MLHYSAMSTSYSQLDQSSASPAYLGSPGRNGEEKTSLPAYSISTQVGNGQSIGTGNLHATPIFEPLKSNLVTRVQLSSILLNHRMHTRHHHTIIPTYEPDAVIKERGRETGAECRVPPGKVAITAFPGASTSRTASFVCTSPQA